MKVSFDDMSSHKKSHPFNGEKTLTVVCTHLLSDLIFCTNSQKVYFTRKIPNRK